MYDLVFELTFLVLVPVHHSLHPTWRRISTVIDRKDASVRSFEENIFEENKKCLLHSVDVDDFLQSSSSSAEDVERQRRSHRDFLPVELDPYYVYLISLS